MKQYLLLVIVLVSIGTSYAGECKCVAHECFCCEQIDISVLGINQEGCLNITYIPSTLSLSLTLSLGSKVWLNETVSLEDPNICVPVPYIDYVVDVCIDFYNMVYSSHDVSGCVKLGFDLFGVDVGDFDLGCFNIPFQKYLMIAKKLKV